MIDGFVWLIGCISAISLTVLLMANDSKDSTPVVDDEMSDAIAPFIIAFEGEDYYNMETGQCSDCDFEHGKCPGSGSNCTDLPGHWEKL